MSNSRQYIEMLDIFAIRNNRILQYTYNDDEVDLIARQRTRQQHQYSWQSAEPEQQKISFAQQRTELQRREIAELFSCLYLFPVSIWKDIRTTFKPYPKSTKDSYPSSRTREWKKPWSGLKDTISGIAGALVATPLLLLNDLYKGNLYSTSFPHALVNTGLSLFLTIPRLLTCIAYTALGVIQIATTPLTWLIKKPIRECLTLIKKAVHDNRRVEDSPSIQKLVEEAKKELTGKYPRQEKLQDIVESIRNKADEKIRKGRSSDIDQTELALLQNMSRHAHQRPNDLSSAKRYIGLFDTSLFGKDPVFDVPENVTEERAARALNS